MKLPERLPRETGRDYALRVLKENIVNLEIAPGSQISENELSAALGISRAPIREALSELEKVKIVEIQPQKKTSVLLIDPALVEEARFMRSTLEDAVIGEVCMQRTEQDLFRLEENLTLQDLAFRSNALDQVMIKDNEFHRYFLSSRKMYVRLSAMTSRKFLVSEYSTGMTGTSLVFSLQPIRADMATVINDAKRIFLILLDKRLTANIIFFCQSVPQQSGSKRLWGR